MKIIYIMILFSCVLSYGESWDMLGNNISLHTAYLYSNNTIHTLGYDNNNYLQLGIGAEYLSKHNLYFAGNLNVDTALDSVDYNALAKLGYFFSYKNYGQFSYAIVEYQFNTYFNHPANTISYGVAVSPNIHLFNQYYLYSDFQFMINSYINKFNINDIISSSGFYKYKLNVPSYNYDIKLGVERIVSDKFYWRFFLGYNETINHFIDSRLVQNNNILLNLKNYYASIEIAFI